MDISALKKGDRAVVLKVEGDEEEKDRLHALGVFPGAKITLLKRFLLGHGCLIEAGGSRLAMGREVARRVLVWRT